MTLLSVVAWVRQNQPLPSVSIAAIRDSRGDTVVILAFPFPSFLAHVLWRKLVSLSQVSSTLTMRFPEARRPKRVSANCCRWTKALSELA